MVRELILVYREEAAGSGNSAQATKNTALFGNTTADAYVSGATIGQFGVDAAEIANAGAEGPRVTHTGWNLRRAGSGGRAGRVHYECLVAGGITGDASDDTQLPE